jgi:hypothetical protein
MNEALMPLILDYPDAGKDYNILQDGLRSLRGITAEEWIRDWEALDLPEWEPELPEELEAEDIFVPEVQFALWVWLPCWYETRRAPVQLLRDARQGDMDALETLLRIDKAVVHDSRISAHVHRAEMTNPPRFERLAKAISSGSIRGRYGTCSTPLHATKKVRTSTPICRRVYRRSRGQSGGSGTCGISCPWRGGQRCTGRP